MGLNKQDEERYRMLAHKALFAESLDAEEVVELVTKLSEVSDLDAQIRASTALLEHNLGREVAARCAGNLASEAVQGKIPIRFDLTALLDLLSNSELAETPSAEAYAKSAFSAPDIDNRINSVRLLGRLAYLGVNSCKSLLTQASMDANKHIKESALLWLSRLA